MKITIHENERGFLFRNGRFIRMLEPGGYTIRSFLGYKAEVAEVDDKPLTDERLFATYGKDKKFLDSVARADVPDNHIALHYADGRYTGFLSKGSYVYWNVFRKHEFKLVDTSDDTSTAEVPLSILAEFPSTLCRQVTVEDWQAVLLHIDGAFVRVLPAGRHFFWQNGRNITLTEYDMRTIENVYAVDCQAISRENLFTAYGKDKKFLDSVTNVDVMDNQIALHYVDGSYAGFLPKGSYVYWNVFCKHEFKLVDTLDDTSTAEVPLSILAEFPSVLCRQVTVEDWQTVLLHIDGAFVRALPAGRHFFWQNGRNISLTEYDMRTIQMEVSGQEILTLDKVGLRVNFVCQYRITDVLKLHNELQDYQKQIYVTLQLALRETVGRLRFDEVLEQKESIADKVFEILKSKEELLFVNFLHAGIKDIILPGEVRDIMNTILVAEKKAQANVITRREEVASTRSLLNTAKLMDENKTLYKLKELEYLEKICENVSNISVNSASGLLEQLGAFIKV